MANKLRVVYYNWKHLGHFPHMYPYYRKLGGLVYITNESAMEQFKQEYKDIKVTSDFWDVLVFNPNIIMYADYHDKLKDVPGKVVMVFHAIELKGYFAIKRKWNSCEKFNLCLLYGDRILQEFKRNGWNPKYKIIGYPRFDYIRKIPEKIFNNDRKTILVAPTWAELSMLNKFTDEIIKLSKKYNIILKPHVQTLTLNDCTGKYMKKLLMAQNDTLKVFGNADILPFMKYADMMITDISGCSCEFMYFNKPIVIADNGVLPHALDEKPDTWNVFKVCTEPKELEALVDSQFKHDSRKKVRREYFKKLVYKEEGSTATERGIRAMEELVGK